MTTANQTPARTWIVKAFANGQWQTVSQGIATREAAIATAARLMETPAGSRYSRVTVSQE